MPFWNRRTTNACGEDSRKLSPSFPMDLRECNRISICSRKHLPMQACTMFRLSRIPMAAVAFLCRCHGGIGWDSEEHEVVFWAPWEFRSTWASAKRTRIRSRRSHVGVKKTWSTIRRHLTWSMKMMKTAIGAWDMMVRFVTYHWISGYSVGKTLGSG